MVLETDTLTHFPQTCAGTVLSGRRKLASEREEQWPLITQGCLNDMHPVMNFQSDMQGFLGPPRRQQCLQS